MSFPPNFQPASRIEDSLRVYILVGVWVFRFDVECVLPVVRILTNAAPPTYQAVLDVEKQMDGFKVATQIEEETPCPPDVSSSMRRWVRLHFVDIRMCPNYFPTSPLLSWP